MELELTFELMLETELELECTNSVLLLRDLRDGECTMVSLVMLVLWLILVVWTV